MCPQFKIFTSPWVHLVRHTEQSFVWTLHTSRLLQHLFLHTRPSWVLWTHLGIYHYTIKYLNAFEAHFLFGKLFKKLTLPPLCTVETRDKRSHGFVGAPCLHLVVRSLLRLALCTLEGTDIVFVNLVAKKSAVVILLPRLDGLCKSTFWIHARWIHVCYEASLDFTRCNPLGEVWVFQIVSDWQKLIPVACFKNRIFPSW